ncbi:MAG: hypothetical protein ILO68_05135, partial [Clostridia bacterium]|nr:hypothetical protein [Clostridia bacterium]
GQLWLSVENMYMLEAAVIGTGGFLLSLEPQRRPLKGSFMKMIGFQSAAAGILAAFAVLVPILFNILPKAFGASPIVSDVCVRPMMTVMMTIAGFVVIFSKCLPFNRYRTFALAALLAVASVLGFLLPSSFIGGETIGEGMLAFDGAAGQTVFDSQLVTEMFRPWNARVIRDLVSDDSNFAVIRLFLFAAVPVFVLTMFALENAVRKEDGKDVREGRAFRIGRRLMLSSGLTLFLRAFLAAFELIFAGRPLVQIPEGSGLPKAFFIGLNVLFLLAFLVIGAFGYKLWKDPTRKLIRVAFVMGAALAVLTAAEILLKGGFTAGDGLLPVMDAVITLGVTVAYIAGSVIVRANISRGLLRPRDA